jgi:hypothetical protein
MNIEDDIIDNICDVICDRIWTEIWQLTNEHIQFGVTAHASAILTADFAIEQISNKLKEL